MKTLDKSDDKIKKICQALAEETLEPAKVEAARIIEDAQSERERIMRQAEQEAKAIVASGRKQLEQERRVFDTSLSQAAKQSMETLRQQIENALFNKELVEQVENASAPANVVASLIEAIVAALAREGIDTDLAAVIPRTAKPAQVNQLLTQSILQKLHSHPIEVGNFAGGAQVKVKDKKMTIDISDSALSELLAGFLREDFRKLFFS